MCVTQAEADNLPFGAYGIVYSKHHVTRNPRHLRFSGVACVTATVATDLAAPDGHKRPRIAVGAAPSQDIPIGGLHDGEDMSRALVGHFDAISDCVSIRRAW